MFIKFRITKTAQKLLTLKETFLETNLGKCFGTELHGRLLSVGYMREYAPPHILVPTFRLAFESIRFRENILSHSKHFLVTQLGGPKNVTVSECHSSQKFPLQQQL